MTPTPKPVPSDGADIIALNESIQIERAIREAEQEDYLRSVMDEKIRAALLALQG